MESTTPLAPSPTNRGHPSSAMLGLRSEGHRSNGPLRKASSRILLGLGIGISFLGLLILGTLLFQYIQRRKRLKRGQRISNVPRPKRSSASVRQPLITDPNKDKPFRPRMKNGRSKRGLLPTRGNLGLPSFDAAAFHPRRLFTRTDSVETGGLLPLQSIPDDYLHEVNLALSPGEAEKGMVFTLHGTDKEDEYSLHRLSYDLEQTVGSPRPLPSTPESVTVRSFSVRPAPRPFPRPLPRTPAQAPL